MTLDERRENGLVYTPDVLVGFILDLAGFSEQAPIEKATVLDPACGAGAFLGEAVRRLARRWQRLGMSLRSPGGRRSFIDALSRQVFGVDVDPNACELARASLRQVAESIVGTSVPSCLFARNIIEADFLTETAVEKLAPLAQGGFAFIVGNPPYVSATRIKPEYKLVLRDQFTTATGRLDLYMLFMERAVGLLRSGGRVGFITPDKFLISQTARPLRSFILQRTAILTIARFTSHKVFADAATVPCISVLERAATRVAIEILHCRHFRNGHDVIEVTRRSSVPSSELTGASWDFVDPDHLAFARRIQNGHPPLASKMVRVSAGPATGRDSIYIVSEEAEVEAELLQPIVRGRDISPYRIADSGAQILVPYRFESGAPAQLINLADYPKARRYLQRHREELESRHCVRVWEKAWYDWHDQPACNIGKETKILVPDLANSSRFAVDTGRFLPVHSVYYLLPRPGTDPFALTAILNSKVAEFIVRLLSPVMKDGFSRYRQQFLAIIPVPDASKQTIGELARAAHEARADRAEELVAKMFKLTDIERSAIERFLVERTSLTLQSPEA
ncbi:MAG: N-6 DNA methylase [Deltaproteobacteria bacterium]|nr:N-6 DNA methylase [Deltaproteobacteria bacterium]